MDCQDAKGIRVKTLTAGAATLGIRLSPAQAKQFCRYYSQIVEWNQRINLTSVTEWTDVQSRHFLDSLSVTVAIPPDMLQSGRFVDIGSGAGLPGVPLKIAFPGLQPTLIESTAKKTAFLSDLVVALGLSDVRVCTGRAEDLAQEPEFRSHSISRSRGRWPVCPRSRN